MPNSSWIFKTVGGVPNQQVGLPEILSYSIPNELLGVGTTCDYPAGIRLFQQGLSAQDAYLVMSGFVKLVCWNETGKEVIVGLRGVGCLMDLAAVILRQTHAITAETLCACRLQRIPMAQLIDLLSRDEKFSWYVHQLHSHEVRYHTEKLAALGLENAARRLRHLLWHVARGVSGDETARSRAAIPLKQWEIAQVLAVSPDQANRELDIISARLAQNYPDTDADLQALLIPVRSALLGSAAKNLWLGFGAAAFVFLIACANVSNMLLSRITARQREMATRLAIGARARNLFNQFLVESLGLALPGAVLAILVARTFLWAICRTGHCYVSERDGIQMDWLVFGFALFLALAATLTISFLSTWRITDLNLAAVLKEGGKTAALGRAGGRRQSTLVVTQVAAAFLLLVGAGALVKSLLDLSKVNPGFDTDHVLTMRIPRLAAQTRQPQQSVRFLDAILAKVKAIPGVEAAGVITYLPMQDWGTNIPMEIENRPIARPGTEPSAEVRAVSSDYYRTMGIGIWRGRGFLEGEGADSLPVVVVNRRFVKEYMLGEEPVGRRIRLPGAANFATIVGVAEDCRQIALDSEPRPEIDLPYGQSPWMFLTSNMSLAVHTGRNLLTLTREVEQSISSVDPDQGVFDVKVMAQLVAETATDERFLSQLLELFSGLALVLAASGLFAQMYNAVTRQTHDIGVRLALGARKGHILRLVLGQAGKLVLLGISIGSLASFLMVRFLAHLIYGGRSVGPTVLLSSALILSTAALLACYLPMRRAMRIDPVTSLRHQ